MVFQTDMPQTIPIPSRSCSLTISVRFKERSDNLKRSIADTSQMKRQSAVLVSLLRACPRPSQSHTSNFKHNVKHKRNANKYATNPPHPTPQMQPHRLGAL
jgi:hypothetical protein